jgi:Protein of unknown function (DUF2950)
MEKRDMRRTKLSSENSCRRNLPGFATLAVALFLFGCFPASSLAQQKDQKTFPTAKAASHALFLAVQSDNEKAILAILGDEGKPIISSGDPAEDKETRANFARRYQEMHRLVKEPNGTTTLYIGAENWPTPIPLVEKAGAWYFDTAAGVKEILFRRVGRNEMSAIRVCQELVAAQREYYAAHNGTFAQKIKSDQGQDNGLYWPVAGSQPESPVGPMVAMASIDDGGSANNQAPEPFRGYYYRILSRQGKDAPGGVADYVVDGKMTAGFAFVAFPAEYLNSGVMTFIVGKDGVIYQKDLGEKTADLAKAMKEYNPDTSWQMVEDQPEQTANAQKTQ